MSYRYKFTVEDFDSEEFKRFAQLKQVDLSRGFDYYRDCGCASCRMARSDWDHMVHAKRQALTIHTYPS